MADRPGLARLVRELKRRRVFRVAGVYAVVAWVMVEVTATVAPLLDLPAWVPTFVLVLIVVGFPVALVLAWAFELTPAGVRRDEAAAEGGSRASAQGPAPRSGPGDEVAAASAGVGAAADPAAGSAAPTASPGASRFTLRRSVWFVLGFLVALTVAWFALNGDDSGDAGGLDEDVVAVLPFRTVGASSELGYLREGAVDLLATKLTGAAGPRAVDPRTVVSAWRRFGGDATTDLPRDSALLVAHAVGAGQLLLGGVVGTPANVTLSAAIVDVASGESRAQATVEGPADSLPALVDRLAARLLSLGAGEGEERLAHLTSTSLPALQAYLEGQAAFREGRFLDAWRRFGRALDLDSTFALAGIGFADAAGFTTRGGERGRRLAWRHRDRLSARDRAYLRSFVGPRYPEPSLYVERLEALRGGVAAVPDRPEAWYHLADHVFHRGARMGLTDWRERSRRHFDRALALDSTFAPALLHVIQLAELDGDTAAIRRLGRRYLEANPEGEFAFMFRWTLPALWGDTVVARRWPAGEFEDWPMVSLLSIGWSAITWAPVWDREGLFEHAERALEIAARSATTPEDRSWTAHTVFDWALNRGQPERARRALAEVAEAVSQRGADLLAVASALYSAGDRQAAEAALRRLGAANPASPPADSADAARPVARCMVAQWHAWNGDAAAARAAAAGLERPATANPEEMDALPSEAQLCALILDAVVGVQENRAEAAARVARLDSLSRLAAPSQFVHYHLNLALARLHEMLGDPDAALAAIRRGGPDFAIPFTFFRAEHLREEGRLAALKGDTAAAIQAYRHYLALRSEPEPVLSDEVERVRRELAALTGEQP